MSTLVQLQELPRVWEPPPSEPLDEAVWKAWVAKGVAEDRRSTAAIRTAVRYASIAVLLATAAIWSDLAPYEIAIRFMVAAGAVFVLFPALEARHYVLAAVFGVLALLYNPLVPMFSLSGDWKRVLVILSTVPFIASLDWPKGKRVRND